MSDSTSLPAVRLRREEIPARTTTLRAQLIWASLFPLAAFVLLSALLAAAVFRQLTLSLALQRDTAIVQALARELAPALTFSQNTVGPGTSAALNAARTDADLGLFLIDQNAHVMAFSGPGNAGNGELALPVRDLQDFVASKKPGSILTRSIPAQTEMIASYAILPGRPAGLILEEPWSKVMTPAYYDQLILIGLLILGTVFSLYMLSLSINRVTGSIAELAENATNAVPGSLFHPMVERGPRELRLLIKAFNRMVVQLAEQQGSLRQYAHQALLSQEEERQRLSHELHDGTMQDLVGLVQRVELCRLEMERDPLLARRRLDELQGLLEQTMGDIRRISNALRPSILEDLGLSAALQALCNDLQGQMPSLRCQYLVTGDKRRLSPDLELAVFRVVQEALGNIRKHVRSATHVEVQMDFGEADIEARVNNDGPAFSSQNVRSLIREGHLGLAGMYERARLFHGELNISSDRASGTNVRLRLPCPSEPD